jgi:hypothetical protein
LKQAILITAYKDFNHLIDILDYFSTDEFEFYVHIDKKCDLDIEIQNELQKENVKLLSRKFRINWGSLDHLLCILYLVEEALKNEKIALLHLISGQDYPAKELEYYNTIANSRRDYMEYFELPSELWKNGGMDRLELYNLYDVLDGKKFKLLFSFTKYLQKILFIKRPISDQIPKLYGGSTWWSLTRDTLQYVIQYTATNKALVDRLKYTFCAEEIYFQTVIMNSKFARNVINDNLRYIDWKSGREGFPAVIDLTDYSSIRSSNKIFARKFSSTRSKELKQMLLASQTTICL